MNTDGLRALLDESVPPFTIATRGGRVYTIRDRANLWAPENFKELLCVVIPGEGLVVLRAGEIESLQIEHETAGTR
jgi:hypothetical protein